jgi:3-phosphoshikimate 1-carboxyvinyltransferase
MVITVTEGPVSKPYIDVTVHVMEKLGIKIERNGYHQFHIPGSQVYRSGIYEVEPDASQAGYFWAAAAIGGNRVKVHGIRPDSKQGDVRFVDILKSMGCVISSDHEGITVTGGPLSAVDADMADMPDMVPTLAVTAAFARGTTRIRNVAHLRNKESDRLQSVANELVKMGIDARCSESELTIKGGHPSGAYIDTYGDHRLAMSFAIAGLGTPGVFIRDETCVEKSFPTFWEVFKKLCNT